MWLFKVLSAVLAHATPGIIDMAQQGARELRKKATETDNPVDDIVGQILCTIVGADKK